MSREKMGCSKSEARMDLVIFNQAFLVKQL
jgi:hypothetical protein